MNTQQYANNPFATLGLCTKPNETTQQETAVIDFESRTPPILIHQEYEGKNAAAVAIGQTLIVAVVLASAAIAIYYIASASSLH